MGQMQFPSILTTCCYRTSNIAKLGLELSTSPQISMLAWKYGGISALLGSRFAAVNQSLFCCSSWEPSVAKAQTVTGQKRRFLCTPPARSMQISGNKTELRGCFSSSSHVPGLTLPSLDCFCLSRLWNLWSTDVSVPDLPHWDPYRITLILSISFLSQAVIFHPQAWK